MLRSPLELYPDSRVEGTVTTGCCMTCVHFNASYKICNLAGEITYPVHKRCERWAQSERDAEPGYTQVKERT